LYWVDKRTLPWRLLEGGVMEECARAQNRPLWICDRMAKELHTIPDSPTFSSKERLTFLSKVEALSRAIGACERIHQTVVPLNYARHSLRSLTVWLISLPFALIKELDLITPPVIFVISWMLFGVYGKYRCYRYSSVYIASANEVVLISFCLRNRLYD